MTTNETVLEAAQAVLTKEYWNNAKLLAARKRFQKVADQADQETRDALFNLPAMVEMRAQFDRLADASWEVTCKLAIIRCTVGSDSYGYAEDDSEPSSIENMTSIELLASAHGPGGTTMAEYKLYHTEYGNWATELPAGEGHGHRSRIPFASLADAVDLCLSKTWDYTRPGEYGIAEYTHNYRHY